MATDQSETKNVFRINRKLKDRVPFAVIGSNCVLQINEKRIRARQYPWGIAEVENSDHCDFKILRDMLIRTHMQVNRSQKTGLRRKSTSSPSTDPIALVLGALVRKKWDFTGNFRI